MDEYRFLPQIDRRTLLKILSFAGISGLIYPRKLFSFPSPAGNSRVIVVEEPLATSGTSIDAGVAQIMVDAGIKILTQDNDLSRAWKMLLPGINSNSSVAIKVNCINGSMPTHPPVTYAVANALTKLNFNGTPFPAENIIIYDRTTSELYYCGYTINKTDPGVRCYGTDGNYTSQFYEVSGANQRISNILTGADYLINISVLKNHSMSGVTLCLKNHYGTCHDPDRLHGNDCDPYIPALNAVEPIKSRQMLNICDALLGIKSGGPGGQPQIAVNKLIFSQDIVAVDCVGRKILKDNQCFTTSKAHHIDTAAQTYGLGTNDPNQMDIIEVLNPTAGVKPKPGESNYPDDFQIEQNFPNPFNSSTRIRFNLAKPAYVSLTVIDSSGRLVRTLISSRLGMGWHSIAWNGMDDRRHQVASGIYLCCLQMEARRKSILMSLIK
ncbi:DUF362 domain-containing protein [candidate division KSB1 bacterium]|nr:DUF362 domain-containing protein [candidate division KSB1 bacterium]